MDDEQTGLQLLTNVYDFRESDHQWLPGFCDFPATDYDSVFFELQSGYVTATIDGAPTNAYYLSGNNHSDDLFMYLKRKVSGLEANTEYTLIYEVQLASDARENFSGIGGAPGESVFLKVGASANEPKSVIDASGNYIMNIDKGDQSADGEDMIVIGNIAVTEQADGFTTITRSNSPMTATGPGYDKPLIVKTNSRGELWLIVGTDSGFEGKTTIYYTTISAVLSRSN